ncbi:helix-turn-helix transcriptional regulator [Paracoccus aestuariivivens]|uniref:HTH domain-containing protein n=1 Tax=Paracoccus aestuariivivens TaxID=1820333 RepID=A0A6L6J3D5_9RHOB|nr:YafY family protein [Paracoccus aestuariivivens]MTH76602.1 HTH domain-containing protein [Paracoccus aestuariivivens]
MSRTDRLMRLMDALRRLPAPVTAARLADETGVSLRQLYRDIATLRAGGALIDGEAGVGYCLTEDPALPPQSFSRLEIEALLLAISGLQTLGDETLSRAGEDALARIIATLPESQGRHAMHATMRLFRANAQRPATRIDMDLLRQSLWDEQSLLIDYLDLRDRPSTREIWPLGMSYSDNSITLLAHCQLRGDFRVFHVPRIQTMQRGPTSFRPRRVALLRDYVTARQATRPPEA